MDELNIIEQSEIGTHGRYLTFTVGSEDYGIEITYVSEIIMVQAMTEVPELPPYLKGIINLRGKILPVMDVRVRFNKEPIEYTDRTCIIVVIVGATSVGLIIDAVREVMDIADDDITAPSTGSGFSNRYISGIGKTSTGVKLLIDLENLVSDKIDSAAF